MNPVKVKRIAARLLKVGESKIWVDPEKREEVKKAITKEDVRGLIAENVVKRVKKNQKSKAFRKGKKPSRKTGPGKKRGTAKARIKTKKKWMANVRAQRKKLRELRKNGSVKAISYRKAYSRIKGGFFRGKKHLEATVAGAKK